MDTSWENLGNLVKIKVIGVGGGGCNAINRMMDSGLADVEFVAINTDAAALALSRAPIRLCIGSDLTRGLGTGGHPEIGAKAAEESEKDLRALLDGADMAFIATGLGGGTGTGASPVIAEIAQSEGALTVAVVTRPFSFEGAKRAQLANEGLKKLSEHVDTLITVQNDRLLQLVDRHVPLQQAFTLADDVLRQGVQAISELINAPGLIHVDFADVRAIMTNGGAALMAIGRASGEERALAAAQQAITSPLLDVDISGALGVLFVVKGGDDLTLHEVSQAADLICKTAAPDANIIFGAVIDPNMRDQLQITVVATGFSLDQRGRTQAREVPTSRAQQPAPQPAPKSSTATPKPFDATDLDIPPFVRRR
ncbi:MAG: cell division protein FtsZ [Chloroflexi bacterium]|nr:cell division protein FtsZ [Chloroflexota bacterium]